MNKMIKNSLSSWLFFCVVVAGYGIFYAPFGLENNDGGFILGLAHQFFLGGSFYDHIIYVRPPVSPILHSFVFYWPFSFFPILADRIFVYLEVAVYSGLSALIGRRIFDWGLGYSGWVALLSFVFSVHAFPPMAWHTIDGILFSILAVYFLLIGLEGRVSFIFLAGFFSILAAGAKQSYYIVPVITLLMTWAIDRKFKSSLLFLFLVVVSILVDLFLLNCFGSVSSFFSSISSQTTLSDLFAAGFKNYLSDLWNLKSPTAVVVWPLLLGVVLMGFIKNDGSKVNKFGGLIIAASPWGIILSVAYFYSQQDGWNQPLWILDCIFIFTLLACTIKFIKTRETSWLVMVFLHGVGWASSISWGYMTAALYFAPSVMTVANFLLPVVKGGRKTQFAIVIFSLATVFVFSLGHRFYYSLEGSISRASMTEDMSSISPILNKIKSTPKQFALYAELMEYHEKLSNCSMIALPNIPLANALMSAKNPIGIDWPMNAEVGNNAQLIKQRMDSNVDFALIFKNAKPSPDLVGKFGSEVTLHAIENWHEIDQTNNWIILSNPSKFCSISNLRTTA